jgi:predicted esterase
MTFRVGFFVLLVLLGCGGSGGEGSGTQDASENLDLDTGGRRDTMHKTDDAWQQIDDVSLHPDFANEPADVSSGGEGDAPPFDTVEGQGVYPLFKPWSDAFFDMPYPSDARRKEDGSLDLSGFPNPNEVPLLDELIRIVTSFVDGYSPNQVIYFAFSGEIATDSFASSPFLRGDAQDPVQLIDVTVGEDFGSRIPILVRFMKEKGVYVPGNLLAIRPVWGVTLKEGHTYAALVTDMVTAKDKSPLAKPKAFLGALDGTLTGFPGLVQSLRPLLKLFEQESGLGERTVVATVFTVGHPRGELQKIRDYLETQAPPILLDIELVSTDGDSCVYEGHYLAPNFLKGTPPYLQDGYFEFDESGEPVIQFQETITFALTTPRFADMPASGWPIVLHSHGTGGDYESFLGNPGSYLSRQGLAVIGINQPLHGDRVNPPLSAYELALYSFNFLNPYAGRTVQRQSIVDNISLVRLVRSGGLRIPRDVSCAGRVERFDPNNILFFGHSQGGITGAMFFGIETRVKGGVLSGAGGALSLTLMHRKDVVDFEEVVRGFLGIDDPKELSEDHPAVMLVQMAFDATDPINYGAFWFDFNRQKLDEHPRNVLMTEGLKDEQTPPPCSEALASAGGLPLIAPYVHMPLGHLAKGVGTVSLPVSGNIVLPDGSRVTGALAQFAYGDHFVIFYDADARRFYETFLNSLAYKTIATISD